MKRSILYFFLLILKVSFYLASNIIYERGILFKTLSEKSLEFVLSEGVNSVLFLLCLMLLLFEVDSIGEKWGHKMSAFRLCCIGYLKIVLVFPTEIITYHIWVSIVEIRVPAWITFLGDQSLFDHVSVLRQIFLGPTWWLSTSSHLCTYPVGLKWERERKLELKRK